MNVDNLLTGIEVKFHVFVSAADAPATYAGQQAVRGGPRSIMNLVKERAEQMAGKKHGIDLNPDISGTWVYKVQLPNNRCGACR